MVRDSKISKKKKCNKCGLCCQGSMGPFIFPSDLESISNFLGIEKQQFLKSYCECNNIPNNAGLIIYSLKMKDRKCVFLNGSNLCEIFEHRPYQCKNAPFKFLSKYYFWKHMPCVSEKDFLGVDSSELDKIIFKELIVTGYK